jgi:Fuc2NAc and GlcNAc transferase
VSAELAFIAAIAWLGSAVLTGLVRRFAVTHGLLDVPNARSSHLTTTPRGGGLAIVVMLSVAICVLEWSKSLPASLFWVFMIGGTAVAAIGFVDDYRSASPALRLIVHVSAAAWAVLLIGGPRLPEIGVYGPELGWVGAALSTVGIVWVLNLFNFMDGIDGIAAIEAVFVATSGSVLTLLGAGPHAVPVLGLILGAAALGFLVWNWPPAKIFLGDTGSGYLGYMIAVLALASARTNPTALWTWLILGGAFFVDATFTLLRRVSRGERVYQAHRTHAYQLLARRWASHRRVTLAVTLVNLVWLLPLAMLTVRYPQRAPWIALVALLPLVAIAGAAGAGRAASADTEPREPHAS